MDEDVLPLSSCYAGFSGYVDHNRPRQDGDPHTAIALPLNKTLIHALRLQFILQRPQISGKNVVRILRHH